MSHDLVLCRRKEGLPLSARTINRALMQISEEFGIRSELLDCGTVIRFRIGLKSDAPNCAQIGIAVTKTGSKVTGSVRGPAAALLAWCFHALARRLDCELVDPQLDGKTPQAPNPRAFLSDAKTQIRAHEEAILAEQAVADEDAEPGVDGQLVEFLEWLVEREKLSLACKSTAEVVRHIERDEDSLDLYESLLECPAVDEIFASEEEFAVLMTQYRDTAVRSVRPSAA